MRAHGSYVRYKQGPAADGVAGKGCRCDECTRANREYVRDMNRRLEPPYVAAGPAREHLRMLSEVGIGLKTVAKTVGVSHGALCKIMHGDKARGQAPSKRIRRTTLDAILAMQPSYSQLGGTRVDAGPIWEMVDELIAAGVPKVRIAERLGQTGPGLQLGRELITRRNAATIKQLHDEFQAGQLVTVKRHRNGDRIIAPKPRRRRRPNGDPHPYEVLAEVLELRNEQTWRRDAACRNRPVYLWFPARGDGETAEHAKKICESCIVRKQCLDANLHERDGIYGGLSPKRRRPLAANTEAA